MGGEEAGALSHSVWLQARASDAGDGGGGQEDVWRDVARCKAAITPRAASSVDIAQRRDAVVAYKVYLRYRAGVAPGMRLLWRGRPLLVLRVIDSTGARRMLELDCEGAAAT
ncbi:MAG: phage head closure protein [Pseudomonadota bacterium]|jgi:SPP1 family predicted phage head-tail adaptor